MNKPGLKQIPCILIALGVLIAFNVPGWRRPAVMTAPSQPSPTIEKWQKKIEQKRPEIVMIGNSTLSVNVDNDAFSVLTKTPAAQVASPGAASAWEYLVMRNIVLRSAHKPAAVAFFFRDHFLTDPTFRVRGFHYGQEIQNVSLGADPLLERLAYLGRKDPLSYFLYRYVPLFRRRDVIKKEVETAVKERTVGALTGHKGEAVEAAIGRVFANDKVDQQSLTLMQQVSEEIVDPARYRFERELPDSFLPAMIKMARDNGIQPWFIRIRSRHDASGTPQPTGLAEYLVKLRAYLEGQGIPLIDLSDAEALKLSYYADGDHINPAGRTLYTQILAERFLAAQHELANADKNGKKQSLRPDMGHYQFVWNGHGAMRLNAARPVREGKAGSSVECPVNAYCEVPGRYELVLGAQNANGRLALRRDGTEPPLAPCPPPADPAFAGLRQAARTELDVTPAMAHRVAPLNMVLPAAGGEPAALAWRLIEPAWSPVAASFDLAPAQQWKDGDRMGLGVAFKVRAIQFPCQAIYLYLIDASVPGQPREALSCAQNYYYVNGRKAKVGDVGWIELPAVTPSIARGLVGRKLVLGAMSVLFPNGIGANRKEAYSCPASRIGTLGLYILGQVSFTAQGGKIDYDFIPQG